MNSYQLVSNMLIEMGRFKAGLTALRPKVSKRLAGRLSKSDILKGKIGGGIGAAATLPLPIPGGVVVGYRAGKTAANIGKLSGIVKQTSDKLDNLVLQLKNPKLTGAQRKKLRSKAFLLQKILKGASSKEKVSIPGVNASVQESYSMICNILIEKAVSKKQQRFMGMVSAVQDGKMEAPSKAIADTAKSMKKKDVDDFAETKHKGLPEKVKEK